MKRGQIPGLLALISLSACLPIPHRHLKRPQVAFAIQDEHGQPIPNAHLTLYSGFIVGKVQSSVPVHLDSLGYGYVERDRERHWFMVFVPDAEAPWVWAWCADAPGYRRAAEELTYEPADTVRIHLSNDAQGARCIVEPHSLYDVGREGTN